MVQYPVYISKESLFFFENAGFCDMMKMVYFMDMPLEDFWRKNETRGGLYKDETFNIQPRQ